MPTCVVCERKLKESQWREQKNYKSCPKCSQENGQEHVYYEYPNDFGRTDTRITSKNPDGPQSQCYECRAKNGINVNGQRRLCSEF